MKKSHKLLLATLSGLLLTPAFFSWGTGIILFIAFIPLLLIEQQLYSERDKKRSGAIIGYAALAFLIFNLLTTWWVKNAAWVGVIAAMIINTSVMTLPFWLFHIVRRRLGDRLGYLSLILLWVAMEFLYVNALVNFPWLMLGNGFANDVKLVQWYEYTGVLGGTIWILVINVLLIKLITGLRNGIKAGRQVNLISWILGFLLFPILFSLIRFYTYEEEDRPYQIVVIQPNIDPYMKFVTMPQEVQTSYLIHIADSLITPETDYVVGPETFFNDNVWEDEIEENEGIKALRELIARNPGLKVVIGATTYRLYTKPSEYTATCRPINRGTLRYDSFNTALQIDSSGYIPFYHKSRLVTGVEFMPYTQYLGFLEKITVKLGGAFRSHGTQAARDAFAAPGDNNKVGPVICWESVFGEYVTDYIKDAGATMLFVITNDGWWGNTPGHRQHNAYAHLRAIETRRSIARSANTGISSMIDQRGVELSRLGWWKRGGLSATLNANSKLTFYVKYGDYLGRISLFLSVILLLYAFVRKRVK